MPTDRGFKTDRSELNPEQALLAAAYVQGDLPEPELRAGKLRQKLRDDCARFHAWRAEVRDALRAKLPSEEWKAAATHAEKAAVRRKKARALEALADEPIALLGDELRAIERRFKECKRREAAALEA